MYGTKNKISTNSQSPVNKNSTNDLHTKSVAFLPSIKDRKDEFNSTKMKREFELKSQMKKSLEANQILAHETEEKY